MICKNCENRFQGNFCNNCGQNSNVRKINFKYLLDEISNSVFQVDRGILFTIKELFTRPRHSIRQFLDGKRKQHFKPLAFIFLVSTIYVMSTYLSGKGTLLGEIFSGISYGLTNDGNELSTITNVLNWMANNYSYSTVILLPFFSFASFLAFIKSKYSYFEHLILNFYIAGLQIVIYIVFSFVYLIIKEETYFLEIIPVGLGILFTFWAFSEFFETKRLLTKVFLIILTYIYYSVQIILIASLAFFLEMLINK